MDRFIALDLETANYDVSSICQIGLVTFENGKIIDEWLTFVDPQMEFNPFHIGIHGISPDMVSGSPKYPDLHAELKKRLTNEIMVTYTCFDIGCLRKAARRHNLQEIQYRHLDASKAVRHTWDKYARDGYGLGIVTSDLGIRFHHHQACEDARAAGLVLLETIKKSGVCLSDWLTKNGKPVDVTRDTTPPPSIARAGNPVGCLFGETIVFTGVLKIPRIQAAVLAAEAGCNVGNGVTKQTTMLVVGDLQANQAHGFVKSGKQVNAEKLVNEGHMIRILSEVDFYDLIGLGDSQ